MLMSVVRTERMGPTGLASLEWKTAANLVIPPSTISSNTTSASARPAWGRASLALSSFTMSATRSALAVSSMGRPVSGATGAVGAAVVVVVGCVAVTRGTSFVPPDLPHAAASARTATNKGSVLKRMNESQSSLSASMRSSKG